MTMYADDTSLCHQSHDFTQLNEAITSDLIKLESLLRGNKLSLNVAKTHSMLIFTKQKHKSLKRQSEALEMNIHDKELKVVQKTKYLGVQIDCSLDWKEQIKTVATKVSRAIGFLKHAKSFLPMTSLKTLYTGIVEPHFRYCCSVWGCAGSTEINQLQSSKIVLPELSLLVALIPQADHLLWSWDGRPLKSSLILCLKQCSSSRSMIWLHNTCVSSSLETQHAPSTTSRALRLIQGCQRQIQQMGKNAFQ